MPGNKNRYVNAAGDTISRYQARKMGKAFYGSTSSSSLQKDVDNRWFNKWSKHNIGQEAMANAQEQAHAEGRPFNAARFKAESVAARNQRPRKGTPGGPAYQHYQDTYGLNQDDDGWRDS